MIVTKSITRDEVLKLWQHFVNERNLEELSLLMVKYKLNFGSQLLYCPMNIIVQIYLDLLKIK